MPAYVLPPIHGRPNEGTNPGSFANAPEVGGPRTFSSPDTPGMPPPSEKTAWDFLPSGWRRDEATGHAVAPEGFEPVTQLEHARLGIVTAEMRRVAEREGHLTPEQVRDEIAAGRLVIPANTVHRAGRLDPMGIGRALKTKVNANMGASPISSDTSSRKSTSCAGPRSWKADTVMDLSTGRRSRRDPRGHHPQAPTVPIGTVPIYSMIIGKPHRGPRRTRPTSSNVDRAPGQAGRRLHDGPCRRACLEHLPLTSSTA